MTSTFPFFTALFFLLGTAFITFGLDAWKYLFHDLLQALVTGDSSVRFCCVITLLVYWLHRAVVNCRMLISDAFSQDCELSLFSFLEGCLSYLSMCNLIVVRNEPWPANSFWHVFPERAQYFVVGSDLFLVVTWQHCRRNLLPPVYWNWDLLLLLIFRTTKDNLLCCNYFELGIWELKQIWVLACAWHSHF